MKPSKLKQHFKSCHGKLVKNSDDYFKQKAEHLKNRQLDSGGIWPRQNKALLEASYRIAFRIAQSKKPHAIGEELYCAKVQRLIRFRPISHWYFAVYDRIALIFNSQDNYW